LKHGRVAANLGINGVVSERNDFDIQLFGKGFQLAGQFPVYP